ncbi:MAG: helix-turn-helix domain-containing protein [Gammaproteobacteria bacterium]|nr:helix-turn-helix domain-containing protein [Gammaproteobacteria bacterium]
MSGPPIRQARKASGLSQQSLAQHIGVSTMAISKYERDLIQPSRAVTNRLRTALQLDAAFDARAEPVALA